MQKLTVKSVKKTVKNTQQTAKKYNKSVKPYNKNSKKGTIHNKTKNKGNQKGQGNTKRALPKQSQIHNHTQ
ncbi:MAG: hypothetical protein QXK06_00815 [Candidatus Diapherotrites archaeon]